MFSLPGLGSGSPVPGASAGSLCDQSSVSVHTPGQHHLMPGPGGRHRTLTRHALSQIGLVFVQKLHSKCDLDL